MRVYIVWPVWVDVDDSEIIDVDSLEVTEKVYEEAYNRLQNNTIHPIVTEIIGD